MIFGMNEKRLKSRIIIQGHDKRDHFQEKKRDCTSHRQREKKGKIYTVQVTQRKKDQCERSRKKI